MANSQEATSKPTNEALETDPAPSSCKGFTLYEAMAMSVLQGTPQEWGLPTHGSYPGRSARVPTRVAPVDRAQFLQGIIADALGIIEEDLNADSHAIAASGPPQHQ